MKRSRFNEEQIIGILKASRTASSRSKISPALPIGPPVTSSPLSASFLTLSQNTSVSKTNGLSLKSTGSMAHPLAGVFLHENEDTGGVRKSLAGGGSSLIHDPGKPFPT